MKEVRKAVIPAAGIGKRFYPLTRAQPKEMLPILDKPVIHYVVEEAVNSGLDEILIIVGHGKDSIIEYFDYNRLDDERDDFGFEDLPNIYFTRQKRPLGLGDSLLYAEKFVGSEPFVVLLGDTIYSSHLKKSVTSQIIDKYYEIKKPLIAVEKVPDNKIRDYGIIDAEGIKRGLWKVKDLVEKPPVDEAPSNLGVTGIYILDNRIFKYIRRSRPGVNGELQLTDALRYLSKSNELMATTFRGKRYDIGTKELWYQTFIEFVKKYQVNQS